MKIINLLKLTFSQIYNRRYMFFLSLVTIGTMFFYLDYMTYASFGEYYQMWKVRDVLADGGENIYSLQFDDVDFVETYPEEAEEFLGNVDENIHNTGGFYVTSVNINQLAPMDLGELEWEEIAAMAMDEESWQQITQSMLVVDKDIMELCDVSMENGGAVSEIGQMVEDGHIPVIMGSAYKGRVERGEILTEYLSGDTYEVAGFFEEGAEWIAQELFYGGGTYLLDDCIMACREEEFTGKELLLASSDLYIISDLGKSELEKEILGIAEKMDISVSVLSYRELVSENKKKNAEAMGLAMVILLIGIVVVALTSVLNSVMTVLERKKEYIVMNVCGVSYRDIFKMICMENFIKMAIPFELAIFIMNQVEYYHNPYRSRDYMYIQNRAVLVMLVYMLVLFVSCSLVSLWYLRKMDINKAGGMFDD